MTGNFLFLLNFWYVWFTKTQRRTKQHCSTNQNKRRKNQKGKDKKEMIYTEASQNPQGTDD